MSTITTQLNTAGTAINVAKGGTGVATMTTAYAPVAAGTTATGNLQVCSTGIGTSGNILTSTGSSSLPTFQAPIVQTVLFTLSSANILAMSATPVQVLAAQGAHTAIVVHTVFLEFVHSTIAYSGSAGIIIQYGNAAFGGGGFPITGILGINLASNSVNDVSYQALTNPPGGGTLSDVINGGVYATTSSPYTLGNGTMRVTLYYSILTTTS
jgi:hypothetical protein